MKQSKLIQKCSILISLMLVWGVAGCSSNGPNTEIISVADARADRPAAVNTNGKGVKALRDGDLERAEQLLTEAIRHDIGYAPAHNNLGALYLMTDQYYLAAWEFEYAAKLVPGDPRPRNNLGLVMEEIGRLDSAIEHYESAIVIEPDNPEYNGNLARTLSRSGGDDQRLRELLDHLVLIDTRPQWRDWADREKLRLRSVSTGSE